MFGCLSADSRAFLRGDWGLFERADDGVWGYKGIESESEVVVKYCFAVIHFTHFFPFSILQPHKQNIPFQSK